ncbi:MAG: hypothetical protein J6S48_05270 [Bacteroidales bacterium]|nr:hypothetical protein [Bacteroidales bacterium]
METTGILGIVSLVINLLLSGELVVSMVTLKSLKKKAEEEAESAELGNINTAVETWKKIVDSLQEQIDRLLEQRTSDAAKIESLSEQVKQQNAHIEELKEQVSSMEMKVKSVNRLEKTIARYEKLLDANGIEY